jgi:excisionase family DNA binding protein
MEVPVQPLLTVCEVARLLHVTPACIRKMVGQGRLESIKIGRTVRFDPTHLAEYIKTNTRHQQRS